MATASTPQPQQGGAQTPAQQPSQSGGSSAPQQTGGTVFRDWASI